MQLKTGWSGSTGPLVTVKGNKVTVRGKLFERLVLCALKEGRTIQEMFDTMMSEGAERLKGGVR